MKKNYTQPEFSSNSFNCPNCGVKAPQTWYQIEKRGNNIWGIHTEMKRVPNEIREALKEYDFKNEWSLFIAFCNDCSFYSVWENKQMIFPLKTELPEPHEDMPEEVKGIYNEAALIYKHSSRASAALLRLAIETMIPQLDDYKISKDKLNNMIGELVKQEIPDHIQQGLDSIRIYGNEGIHPGEIVLGDDDEIVQYLFELINYMTEELITRKKKVKTFYAKLPTKKLEGILRRDKSKK